MSDNKPQGGAGSSLGAHSKDTSHTGTGSGHAQGPSSSSSSSQPQGAQPHGGSGMSGQSTATQERGGSGSSSAGWQQAGAEMADQAKEGVERVAHNVREAAASARDTIATRGSQAIETTGQMVRDQPMMALAVTGIACFAIGMMIGRGRY